MTMASHTWVSRLALLGSVLGTFAVGVVDYLSGLEIRIFPLYFLPLALAAWFVGKTGALLISLLSALVWLGSLYLGGREYSSLSIWFINFATQATGFAVIVLLVSSLHDALQRERALSRTDSLTGLCNSRAFHEQAAAVLNVSHRHERPITLAYLDLDNFKQVNDTQGHARGDQLLRDVAAVFNRRLRGTDLAARLGGDEFAILLPETTAEEARVVLEAIRQALSAEFSAFRVTASIGAVGFAKAPGSLQNLLQKADALMYEVKSSSKNRVRVESC